MNRTTKTLMQVIAGIVLCCFAGRGYAQDAKLQLGNLDKLSEKAARVTDVTLDGSLLDFAVKLIESSGGAFEVASDNGDDAVGDGGEDEVFSVDQEQPLLGVHENLRRTVRRRPGGCGLDARHS